MSIIIHNPNWTFQPSGPPTPPPTFTGGAIPSSVITLAPSEYVWSDTHDNSGWSPNAVTSSANLVNGYTGASPGWYCGPGGGSAVMWQNASGDWWDASATPVAQGSVAYVTKSVTTTGLIDFGSTAALVALVQGWLAGTAPFPNAGFIFIATNTNNDIWYTSRGTTPPTMTITASGVDTVVACTRSIALDASTQISQETATTITCTTSPSRSMLFYFDLTSYIGVINPANITAVKITLFNTQTFGTQTINVFAVRNANDPKVGMPAQQLGLAANYLLDGGIENDPAVLFCQHFPSIAQFQADWLCVQGTTFGNSNSFALATTDDTSGSGFYRLPAPNGQFYNALQIIYNPINQSAYEGQWNTWIGTGSQRLPGKTYTSPPDELFLRYYVFLPGGGTNAWVPQPQGGKFPGFDGRFAATSPPNGVNGIFSMGRGNGGSGADGITGFSYRGTYGAAPPTGAPNQNLYSCGSPGDVYDLYASLGSNSGIGLYSGSNHYLGMFRQNEWHCIELHLKLNSVTQPTQKPRRLSSLTCSGTTATAVFTATETDLTVYQTGQVWSIGGSATAQYGGPHAITVVDPLTFTFTVPAGTPSPAVLSTAALWAVPGQANADGVMETYIDGRLQISFQQEKARHTKFCTDGVTNFGIDNVWFAFYHGGLLFPAHNFSCYIAEAIVATKYIGPMVQSLRPAWMNGLALGQWYQFDGLGSPARGNSKINQNFPYPAGPAPVSPDANKIFPQQVFTYRVVNPYETKAGTYLFGESCATRAGTKMIMGLTGGGANSYCGTHVMSFDLGVDSPTTWVVDVPNDQIVQNIADGYNNGLPHPDAYQYYGAAPGTVGGTGTPIPMHTYGRNVYFEQAGSYANHLCWPGFTMGWYEDSEGSGITNPNDGALYNERFCGINLTTKTWYQDKAEISPGVLRFPDLGTPAIVGGVQGLPGNLLAKHPLVGTAFDEVLWMAGGGKILIFDPHNPQLGWQQVCASTPWNATWYGSMAIDTTARRLVCLFFDTQNGTPFHGYYMNLGTNPNSTLTPVHYTLTGPGADRTTGLVYEAGSPSNTIRPGFVYEPNLDCFVVFQGEQRIWTMKKAPSADTFDVQIMGTVSSVLGTPPGTTAIGPVPTGTNYWNGGNPPPRDTSFGGSKCGYSTQYFPSLGGIAVAMQSTPTSPFDVSIYFIRTTA